ncbi:MAG TPA: Ig-like domain-containing protein [Deltaproteobacteria bacterium]|nr:Ig-like domain-containing protein [Deltaproteobacteria bacterium]HOM29105.1 Ig-like domain-containing protein [Deltaproteobacteria bacterium]HPP80035.1 Ig-like domain-containing protein [Deltaproteobacteria bacterium]
MKKLSFALACMCTLALTIGAPRHLQGEATWSQASYVTDEDLFCVTGWSDGEIYACGEDGELVGFDGVSWDEYPVPRAFDLRAIALLATGDLLVTGDMGIVLTGSPGGVLAEAYPVLTDLNALWLSSDDAVITCGDLGKVLVSDGDSWSDMSPENAQAFDLYCAWGTGEEDFWVGGSFGRLWHYRSGRWASYPMTDLTTQTFRALWGASEDAVFAAGTLGHILAYDGSSWSIVHTTDGLAVYALWGTSDDDIFASGEMGFVYHYDGGTWSRIRSPGTLDIYAIWGGTSGRVYFVGENGLFLVYSREDTYAPSVVHTSPTGGSTGVPRDTSVVFVLSEEVDPSTVDNASVRLTDGNQEVQARVSSSANRVTLTPEEALEPSTRYTATLSQQVADPSGNRLGQAYTISFTTAATTGEDDGGGGSGCFVACCSAY